MHVVVFLLFLGNDDDVDELFDVTLLLDDVITDKSLYYPLMITTNCQKQQ